MPHILQVHCESTAFEWSFGTPNDLDEAEGPTLTWKVYTTKSQTEFVYPLKC